ncbi:hypothetical protein [Sphingomonas sp.]|uniref:hypothetical protein n=1 Tax=Sphingomonas sp. TaxID=28214 RepID=UPI00286BC789|nr:hypothetical protein [Sphingomonas sp.]
MRRLAFAVIAAAFCLSAQPAAAKSAVYMSLMGEPFRTNAAGEDPFDQWYKLADRDSDGTISRLELQQDAQAFFTALDANDDKVIDADEMAAYERDAPARTRAAGGGAAAVSSRRPTPTSSAPVAKGQVAIVADGSAPSATRIHPGGGPISLSSVPQPVAMTDTNLDRRVTVDEFNKAAGRRFTNYDTDQDGKLTRKELR